jgi:hypothetical protein
LRERDSWLAFIGIVMSALQGMPNDTTAQSRLKPLGQPFAFAILVALAVLGVTAVGWFASHHSFGYFTRDPAAITDQAPYMGMVSFFGLFAWAAGATALVFGGYIASLRGALDRRNALLAAGVAVVYLLLDDSFQFHEYVYPRYLHLPDSVVELAYVIVTAVLLVKGRSFLSSSNLGLLVSAGVFLGISIAFDVLITNERVIALEDGAKLIGICLLAAYCVDTALAECRQTFRELTSSAPREAS